MTPDPSIARAFAERPAPMLRRRLSLNQAESA